MAKFPADPFTQLPRAWIEQSWNVQQYTELDSGGHFPGLEQPGPGPSAVLIVNLVILCVYAADCCQIGLQAVLSQRPFVQIILICSLMYFHI